MRVVNLKQEKYTHYIGRGSVFGNPFKIDKDGNRKQVIEKFDEWIKSQPKVLTAIYKLPSDAILGCFCVNNSISFIRQNKKCHGDIIIKIWKELHNAD